MGSTVAMVTYCDTKMITMFTIDLAVFGTMIVASSDNGNCFEPPE